MPGGVFGHQMSLESFVKLALISAPTCVSACIRAPQGWLHHILQDTATFRSTMPLRLLGCGAPGTLLIIYLACVYLCWTRLSERGSQGGKADTILPARVHGARKIQRDCRHCGDVRSRVWTRTSGRQRWQQCSDANRGYGLTYTQTHNLIDIKKQSILGSIVSNVFNVNGTLRGRLLLC